MQAQFINCPSCGTQIELSETLAHPFVEAVKAEYGVKLAAAQNKAAIAETEKSKVLANIEAREAALDAEIAKGVAAKRVQIENSIREEIEAEVKAEVDSKDLRIQKLIAQLDTANAAQLELEEAKQMLEMREKSIALEIAKGINAKLDDLRVQAEKDAAEAFRLKIAELNKKLEDTTEKLEEAKKKAQQGSQQLQGEVLELDIEERLCSAFPWDTVEEVKKGQRGADCLQRVMAAAGARGGTILWESKRTQNWNPEWISKLKNDARDAKAEVAVIVTEVVPSGCDCFTLVEGVWVVKPSYAVALAHALRETILKTVEARRAAEGKQTKAGVIYDYVTGSEFRARLEGIAEPFKAMQTELSSERRLAEQRFNRRQKQLDRVLTSCFGMVGDLHEIAGQDIAGLEAIELRALSAGESDGDVQGDSEA